MKGERTKETGLSKDTAGEGGKEGGKGKRNYNQKCMYDGFLSYCKYGHFIRATFTSYSHPFDTDCQGVISDQCSPHRVESPSDSKVSACLKLPPSTPVTSRCQHFHPGCRLQSVIVPQKV